MDVYVGTVGRPGPTTDGDAGGPRRLGGTVGLHDLRAADLVRPVPTVLLEDGVAAALEGAERGGVVAVLDSCGLCRGLIDRPEAEHAVRQHLLVDGPATIGELPLRRPAAVGLDTSLGAIAWTLSMSSVPAVPVVDAEGHHLGVVTAADVLGQVAHALTG
jgi:CBS domain-containing protein